MLITFIVTAATATAARAVVIIMVFLKFIELLWGESLIHFSVRKKDEKLQYPFFVLKKTSICFCLYVHLFFLLKRICYSS